MDKDNDKPNVDKPTSQPKTNEQQPITTASQSQAQTQPISSTNHVKVPNHMVMAIISLFFFWPLSIPALIYSNKVNSLLIENDVESAKIASKKAKIWSLIAFGAWGAFFLLGIFLILLVSLSVSVERKLANQFVNDISAGNTSKAYSQFSNEIKNVQSETDFDVQISSMGLDESCKFKYSGFKVITNSYNGTESKVSGSVKCNDFNISTAVFIYNKDHQLVEYGFKP